MTLELLTLCSSGGGAIYNRNNASIGDITGSFKDNYAIITANSEYGNAIAYYNGGGAIYLRDNTKIGNIKGDFISNYAIITALSGGKASDTSNSGGGAIYNGATVGDITGNFIKIILKQV